MIGPRAMKVGGCNACASCATKATKRSITTGCRHAHVEELTTIRTARSHTAILFFSHRPVCEWRNKQFVRHDRAKSEQVADALYAHTLGAARDSGLPVLEVTDARQRGRSFGARLANAFADVFAAGYDRVIAVGSDCPRLHEVDWASVADHLAQGTSVLGPTRDGHGTYLIGLNRAHFDRTEFAALPWQTSALFGALAQHLAGRVGTAPTLLAARDDVNGHRDLVALLRAPAALPRHLLAQLRVALGPVEYAAPVARCASAGLVSNHPSRAPPLERFRARA